jgi:hypothetical protein
LDTTMHKTLVRKLKPNKAKRQTKVHKTLVRKLKPNKTKKCFVDICLSVCFIGF